VNAKLRADPRDQCQACHTFAKGGRNMVGPNLWGVVGRTDLLSVADSGLKFRFERTQRSSAQEASDAKKNRSLIPTEEGWLIAGLFVV
jgi:cytochrome c2